MNNCITTFGDLLDLYLFDRELRLIVSDVLERIEIAIRSQIIYQLSHKHGSHWQDNPAVFVPAYKTRKEIKVDVFNDIQKIILEHCSLI